MQHKSEEGRFYSEDGVCYNDLGLAKARELLLYPSVTYVLNLLATPYPLQRYKEQRLVLAAATERHDGADDDQFVEQVLKTYDYERREAADRGKAVHSGIQHMMQRADDTESESVNEQLAGWMHDHLGHGENEIVLVDTGIGTAGTADYVGPYVSKNDTYHDTALVDFKTQGVKFRKDGRRSPSYYPEWAYQLGGYAEMWRRSHVEAPTAWVSVVINTNEDHPDWSEDAPGIWVKEWKRDEIIHGWLVFQAVVAAWYLLKQFPAPGTSERERAEEALRIEMEQQAMDELADAVV